MVMGGPSNDHRSALEGRHKRSPGRKPWGNRTATKMNLTDWRPEAAPFQAHLAPQAVVEAPSKRCTVLCFDGEKYNVHTNYCVVEDHPEEGV
jgi:hypothetical protein